MTTAHTKIVNRLLIAGSEQGPGAPTALLMTKTSDFRTGRMMQMAE
jgi:hypothetical protein